MAEKRAQIAFAPVRDGGPIYLACIGEEREVVRRDFGEIYGSWREAEADGWHIRPVKIEVVDD